MSSRSKTFRLEIARPRRRNSAGFIYPVRMRLEFGRKATITVNQWRRWIHHGELLFPALQCITFPDTVGNVSRLNTHLIPCMLLEGGREMKTILSVQFANCIRMVLQITEGIDVGAGDNVLGPSIIRSLSLILPGSHAGKLRKLAGNSMQTRADDPYFPAFFSSSSPIDGC